MGMKEEEERLFQFNREYTVMIIFAMILAWSALPFFLVINSKQEPDVVQVSEAVNKVYVVSKNHSKAHAFTTN
jgi:hypothetical protein